MTQRSGSSRQEWTRRQCLAAALGAAAAVTTARPASAAAPRARSRVDYFSFLGRDSAGLVGFAIDNSRGRTGNRFNARNFVAFHDQAAGWQSVIGDGGYLNRTREIDTIPPSEHFVFSGDRRSGVTMRSPANGLTLVTKPFPPIATRRDSGEVYVMSAAPATLTWRRRRIAGRMIHEQLISPVRDLDRMDTATVWKNFNGFYLMSDDGRHDLYFHHYEGEPLRALFGRQVAIATWDRPAPLDDLAFTITRSKPADNGRFTWPLAWTLGFTHLGTRYSALLDTTSWNYIYDWGSGGFAMAMVAGTATSADGARKIGLTGFGEFLI